MKMSFWLDLIISLPKTIYFNLRMFPISEAILLPMFINYKTKFIKLKRGKIKLKTVKTGIIQFGFRGTEGIPLQESGKNYLAVGDETSMLVFEGSAKFAKGTSLLIGGDMTIGDKFSSNKNCSFSCNKSISFGEDCLLGWNVHIRDSDNHTVIINGCPKETDKDTVIIGDHVWLCANVDVLKGAVIPNNSIVAYRACVLGKFHENNILLGGFPAKIIKTNVDWNH